MRQKMQNGACKNMKADEDMIGRLVTGLSEYGDSGVTHMHNEGTPRYNGPRELAQSLTALAHMSATAATWNREGLREDSEYRDLGLAAVTNGRIGAKHIRALKPMTEPTGWHWHDMTAHYLYVLRGWITFRFAGAAGEVTLHAGDGLSQPAGVPHNVISRSDDLEVIEINEPAVYGTWDLAEPPAPWK